MPTVLSRKAGGGSGGGAPSGPAGGSLAGTYPNPTVAAGVIGAAEIAANAVGSSELADNAVDTNAIANNAVTAAKVAADVATQAELDAFVPSLQYESRNSNTILGVADKGKTISYSAAVTQTFEADETLGDGWWVTLKNGAAGVTVVTCDPAGGETIDGLATLVLFPGEARQIYCNGAGGNFNSVCLDPGSGLYVEGTNVITIASTTEATPTDVLSLGAITYDGAPIWIEFWCVTLAAVDSGAFILSLWDASTDLGRWSDFRCAGNQEFSGANTTRRRLTPAAGAHTLKVTGFKSGITGAATVECGAGGAGVQLPMYLRAWKA